MVEERAGTPFTFQHGPRLSPGRRRDVRTVLALGLAACAPSEAATPADTVAPVAEGVAVGIGSASAGFVNNVLGFQGPESVRYDPEQDAYLVSNIVGYGSAKDDDGYITRVDAGDPHRATILVRGGTPNVTLDAPKGLAIHGDTLWVADIDVLRGFDRRTGVPLATIDFAAAGAVMLNDVAVAPDGTLRVTDTGIHMNRVGVPHTGPDRIYAVGPGGAISVVAEGLSLRQPNGIAWDSAGRRWIVVSFVPFVGEVAALDASGRRVLGTGTGRLDGVEVLRDGSILFTSWADSSLHRLRGGRDERIVREVPDAADIGVDTRRNRVAIPLSTLGRVQLWQLRDPTRR
jgi:sugar lactone lactonase YvrE